MKSMIRLMTVITLIFALAACMGAKEEKETEPVGSLVRTFTLVDEKGLESGKLVIDPFGSIKLYDGNGNLLRQHDNYPQPDNETSAKTTAAPEEAQPAVDTKEAQPAVAPEEVQPAAAPEKTQTTEPTGQ